MAAVVARRRVVRLTMRDVFISHVEEDGSIALAVARGLHAAGYTTWCYEDDSDPGPSYLSQIDEEIETAQAVVLIVSARSLTSGQVLKEVVRAHEAGKPFIPLRRGVTHEAIQQQRDWRMALGASVSIAMSDDRLDDVLPRVIRGLERSGVRPRQADASGRPADPVVPVHRAAPGAPVMPAPPSLGRGLSMAGQRLAQFTERLSDSTRLGITTVIGILGVIGSSTNLLRAVNPNSQERYLYQIVPAIGHANVVGNAAGLALNLVLLYFLWQLFNGYTLARPRIRLVGSLMLISITVWFISVAFAAMFPPYDRLRGADKMQVIGAAIVAALIAGVPAAVVRQLYRR